MRRTLLAIVFAGLTCSAMLVPACHSNGADSQEDAGGDAALGSNAALGSPCDFASAVPCAPGSSCYQVSCDPIQGICVQSPIPGCGSAADGSPFEIDGGRATDARSGGAGCYSSGDCPDDTVCGFQVEEACAATGVCVIPDPPTTASGSVYVACGCSGQPVLYVTPEQTSAPVQSGSPCSALVEAGSDASDGAPATDGATDGGFADGAPATDANPPDGTAIDANSPDGSLDSSTDSATDAGSD